jgi:hypothetical protein
MKGLITAVLLGLTANTAEQSYKSFFLTEIIEARTFIKHNLSYIKNGCKINGHSEHVCMAIVYPELLRYNSWKELLESSAMELAYVRWGSEVVDFSIGRFQMKASFAEYIEAGILKHDMLNKKYAKHMRYGCKIEKDIRKSRIARLKSTVWQLQYVNAFYDLCLITYPELKAMSESELVFALATLYNRGFKNNLNQLLVEGHKKQFPYGAEYPGTQFSYGAISSDYFKSKTTY